MPVSPKQPPMSSFLHTRDMHAVHPHTQHGTNHSAIIAGGLVSAGHLAGNWVCLTAAQSRKDALPSERSTVNKTNSQTQANQHMST
jgi:uncharacterized protein (DUF1501 family)